MNQESKGKWDGLRGLIVARQSDGKNGKTTAQQVEYMLLEFERVGIKYVDCLILDDTPASAPARITQIIETLFARKKKDNDFDVIAWQVEDRASRGGGEHGMWLEHEALRRGLRVFFAGDVDVRRPYESVVKVAKYEAAKEASVNTGRRSRQGQSDAKKRGTFRTSGPTSWGCYRLYLDENDTPKFFIRNLTDGRQEQIDSTTGAVIGRFGTVGEKSRHRFKKQRNEYSLLMPGERITMRVVRVIFYLRYKRGWGACKIADFLNRNGILAPRGGDWSPRQVQIIYENEAYTGVTVNDRTFSGRYYTGNKKIGYVALDRDEIDLVLKKTFTPKFNPEEQWDRIDQPYMHDFLPKDVRDLAINALITLWRERADPTRPKKKSNGHPASNYLLSDLLKAKQDNKTLTGTLSGHEGSKVEYYRHARSRKGRRKGSIYNNLIRADVLHKELVRILADLLLTAPDLRDRLTAALEEHRKTCTGENTDASALQAEGEELDLQIKTLTRKLKGAALAAVADELGRMGVRRNVIAAQLARMRQAQDVDQRPAADVVDQAMALLKQDSQQLLKLPTPVLRILIRQFVLGAEVDMKTKEVQFSIALPSWALKAPPKAVKSKGKHAKTPEKLRCVPQNTRSLIDRHTQQWLKIECEYRFVRGSHTQPPCYECRRQARAA